jgi:hypothetical protein
MRLLPGLLGLLLLAAPVSAWAAECENSPYNCKVPNTEDPVLKNGETKDRNRKFNDFDQTYLWGLVNQPELKDGEGGVRGHVKGDAKFNFGQRKTIGGAGHVYAFAVGLVEGGSVSGWVLESSVYRKNTIAKMPTASPDKPGNGYYETDWVVSGGDLTASGSLALNDKYGNRKVNPNVAADEHQAASDYLVRQWDPANKKGYINFLYNLPGVGGMTTDTLPMCVHFKRFKDVPELEIELYFVDSSSKSDLSLHFDYGEIDGRRGWITKEMLTAAQDLTTLAPGHPSNPTVDPGGMGGMGQAGSGDPGGSGGDPGAGGSAGDPNVGGSGGDPGAGGSAGDPGAGGQPGAGGDSSAGQAGSSPAGAGGAASGAGGAGGTKAGGGGSTGGASGTKAGAGGTSSGSAGGGKGGATSGAGGAKSGGSGVAGGGSLDQPADSGEATSDGGCALLTPRPRSHGGLLGLALALGIAGRRWRRRARAAG